MIYVLSDDASKQTLKIKGELFKYLVKVRRHSVDDVINFRNKQDIKKLYSYKVISLDGRTLELELIDEAICEVKSSKNLHIGWCKIDAKSVEKVLASLNEIGVSKITFIDCDRSQKNFKLDYKRFERILDASSQQCGRTSQMEFDSCKNLKEFITKYPDTKVFDFCDTVLKDADGFETVLIGCEGGFSQDEKELLSSQDVFRLNNPMVMRSESAVLAVASKILL
ncbi:MAG: 16S rRNA (uracil(1498)-N(3))-methyltransferase [Campylobacterales bacterium]